ncbi:MAG: hypothetical protein ACK5FG_04065 [Chryseotalea sp.]
MRYGFENSFNFIRQDSHSAYTDRCGQACWTEKLTDTNDSERETD